ncbi:hypothetical protein [Paenibacillus herberti]|uniref:Uncharacterized protein n=1 Tax=Paenibacillus herberti TaxID=1619309 RepID=A0A229P5T6_9BACL|nr:hypothetical protein [Paenibacillus herberti]OXM17324.1 hypothetical protein CGZ75_12180 [Paenibacillus herberti]
MSAQQQAQELRFLVEMAGWQQVESFIAGRIHDRMQQLRTCGSWEEVIQHRAGVEALESVLLYISTTIEKGIDDDEPAD